MTSGATVAAVRPSHGRARATAFRVRRPLLAGRAGSQTASPHAAPAAVPTASTTGRAALPSSMPPPATSMLPFFALMVTFLTPEEIALPGEDALAAAAELSGRHPAQRSPKRTVPALRRRQPGRRRELAADPEWITLESLISVASMRGPSSASACATPEDRIASARGRGVAPHAREATHMPRQTP
jgi:hypothetical protein